MHLLHNHLSHGQQTSCWLVNQVDQKRYLQNTVYSHKSWSGSRRHLWWGHRHIALMWSTIPNIHSSREIIGSLFYIFYSIFHKNPCKPHRSPEKQFLAINKLEHNYIIVKTIKNQIIIVSRSRRKCCCFHKPFTSKAISSVKMDPIINDVAKFYLPLEKDLVLRLEKSESPLTKDVYVWT